MNFRNKKKLIARTLNVGMDKIILNKPEDIKEAITRQDIRDLVASNNIIIRENKGRKKVHRISKRKSKGNIKKSVGSRKEDYMHLVRKLRRYVKVMKKSGKITKERHRELRKKIRSKEFKSLSYLQDYIQGKTK